MAKTRPGKRDADSYTIRGTNKVVRGKENNAFYLFPKNVEEKNLIFVFWEAKWVEEMVVLQLGIAC